MPGCIQSVLVFLVAFHGVRPSHPQQSHPFQLIPAISSPTNSSLDQLIPSQSIPSQNILSQSSWECLNARFQLFKCEDQIFQMRGPNCLNAWFKLFKCEIHNVQMQGIFFLQKTYENLWKWIFRNKTWFRFSNINKELSTNLFWFCPRQSTKLMRSLG